MQLYALDDERNAGSRDHRTQTTLRPVRPVAIGQPAAAQPAATYAQPAATYGQPAYAPPAYAPAYAQPAYAQPAYAQPGYGPAGYYGGGYAQPWGWNGPNGAMYYGAPPWAVAWGPGSGSGSSNTAQNLASGLGALIEIGTSLVAAFQSLPVAPNADESTVLANVTDYQRRLAEHAKGDERLRTIGSAGGKVVDLAVKLFSSPSSGAGGAFMAPRGWY